MTGEHDIPDHQQHREGLRQPVTGVALVLEREDFRTVQTQSRRDDRQ